MEQATVKHASYEMKIDQPMSKPHHQHLSFNHFNRFLCGFLNKNNLLVFYCCRHPQRNLTKEDLLKQKCH